MYTVIIVKELEINHYYELPTVNRGVGRGVMGVSKHPQLRSSAVFHISLHFSILKMISTSGFLTAVECTKFDSGPAGALPRTLLG